MFLNEIYNDCLKLKNNNLSIKYFNQTESTNEEAWKNSAKLDEELMVFFTKNQIKGKGSRGSKWHSCKNKSLTFSIKKKINPLFDKFLSLKIGVIIVKAINKSCGIKCKLKWPNDILFNKKKIGGILIEKNNNIVVIGIGINVNEEIKDFEPEIYKKSTSLKLISNTNTHLEKILAFILNEYEIYKDTENKIILNDWIKYCDHLNDKINFHKKNKLISGRFQGLHDDGRAIIKFKNKEELISGGLIFL
tara:strand:+ start:153 stop:896 length:744 start_codon:yes stop_codon:yes gene_type:complete